MRQRKAADIVLAVNQTLAPSKVSSHVQLQRLAYNEKRNLSRWRGVRTLLELKEQQLAIGIAVTTCNRVVVEARSAIISKPYI